jgi:hypothetical protein
MKWKARDMASLVQLKKIVRPTTPGACWSGISCSFWYFFTPETAECAKRKKRKIKRN